jgi:hypothetical protein
LRRTHHFIELWNFRDAGAENSHTQHMILRRIAATAPAVQRHVWDWVLSPLGVHVGKYCRGTRPARIEPFFHGGCRWAAVARLSGCMRFAALASCMSCRLQRDGALAMQCGCGSLLGRRQGGLCVGSSPGSVQRGCRQGPLVHSPSVSQVMHMASHLACAKGEREAISMQTR